MDQKIASAGGKLTAIVLWFCAFIITPVAIGMLFSFPNSIWLVGVLLLLSAVLLIKGGISSFKQANRMEKEADDNIHITAQQLGKPSTTHTSSLTTTTPVTPTTQAIPSTGTSAVIFQPTKAGAIVMAHWKYSNEEWKRFKAWEIKERKSNTTIEAILIVVLGGIFVMFMRSASWLFAFGINTFVALVYWIGKYYLSMASIGQARGKQNEVVITQYAVIINRKYNAFISENYTLRNIQIRKELSLNVLEIAYNFQSRKGISGDEIRVPIPEGKLDEAKWLQKVLTQEQTAGV